MRHESAQQLRDDLVERINEALARGMTLEDVSIVVRDVAREAQALLYTIMANAKEISQ